MRNIITGLLLLSLAGLATAAPASFTEDTIYLQCTGVDRSGTTFVAITPPANKASVFFLITREWLEEVELLTVGDSYMFDMTDDWNFVIDRVDLTLYLLEAGSADFARCSIVEAGAAENYALQHRKPRI